jgi:hypothetical protein
MNALLKCFLRILSDKWLRKSLKFFLFDILPPPTHRVWWGVAKITVEAENFSLVESAYLEDLHRSNKGVLKYSGNR